MLYLLVWVDDFFLFFPPESKAHAATLWLDLRKSMDFDDAGPVGDCLGCNVSRDFDNNTVYLSQASAIKKFLKKINFLGVAAKPTPMVTGLKLSKKDCPDARTAAVMTDVQRWYRSVVASLIYFANWTRPDIAYAVSKLCRYMHNPGDPHIIALKRLLRYLAGTADYGLKYSFADGWRKNAHEKCVTAVHGFFDAAHADCIDTLRSTMAYVFFFGPCPISWSTKLHTVVTTATNHSEYCASAKAAREARWFHNLCHELSFLVRYVKPIEVYSDSQGSIAMAYNPTNRNATKHIALADHFTREQQEEGIINVSYVRTTDMIADALTKPLGNNDFARHLQYLLAQVVNS